MRRKQRGRNVPKATGQVLVRARAASCSSSAPGSSDSSRRSATTGVFVAAQRGSAIAACELRPHSQREGVLVRGVGSEQLIRQRARPRRGDRGAAGAGRVDVRRRRSGRRVRGAVQRPAGRRVRAAGAPGTARSPRGSSRAHGSRCRPAPQPRLRRSSDRNCAASQAPSASACSRSASPSVTTKCGVAPGGRAGSSASLRRVIATRRLLRPASGCSVGPQFLAEPLARHGAALARQQEREEPPRGLSLPIVARHRRIASRDLEASQRSDAQREGWPQVERSERGGRRIAYACDAILARVAQRLEGGATAAAREQPDGAFAGLRAAIPHHLVQELRDASGRRLRQRVQRELRADVVSHRPFRPVRSQQSPTTVVDHPRARANRAVECLACGSMSRFGVACRRAISATVSSMVCCETPTSPFEASV